MTPPTNETWQLARISCSSTEPTWVVNYRPVQFRDEAIEAITVPAPRWNERTNGTKHGDWSAYTEAHELAEQAGWMLLFWSTITPSLTATVEPLWSLMRWNGMDGIIQ